MCIVGSGAGGGVIAGRARQGGSEGVRASRRRGYFNESDFNQLELSAYEHMYWRGGPQPTADFNVTVLRRRGPRRRHGDQLDQLPAHAPVGAGAVGDASTASRASTGPTTTATSTRSSSASRVNDRCSDLNGPHQRMKEGADALGWSFGDDHAQRRREPLRPGVGRATWASATRRARSRARQRTYLQDAFDAGADIVVRCTVDRVLVESGRAAGVEGTWLDPETGRTARVTVRAPQVVVAAGSLESPALLLRSRIGGPAVGNYLRIHPCTALFGIYGEDQEAWWGAPQAGLVDEFADVEDGYGFLVESDAVRARAGRLRAALHDARRSTRR